MVRDTWEFLEGASRQAWELGFVSSSASRGARLCSLGSWALRAPANHPAHSVIWPPRNQSSQALGAAGRLNYRLWADGGDGSVCAIQGEKGVKGPPSPDSRHPLFWRARLPAAMLWRPLSPGTHPGHRANRRALLPAGSRPWYLKGLQACDSLFSRRSLL